MENMKVYIKKTLILVIYFTRFKCNYHNSNNLRYFYTYIIIIIILSKNFDINIGPRHEPGTRFVVWIWKN